ncbi:MAG: glycosyltransferase [Acidimicrobiia bacterium]|nr:glycosyltransferase [Acidimicrobiia bacterium]
MTVAVLTLVRDRNRLLARLVEALDRSDDAPAELVVARAGGEDPAPVLAGPHRYRVRVVGIDDADRIAYSAGRNAAAAASGAEDLVFIDADTFPTAGAVGAFDDALRASDAICLGEILYLPEGAVHDDWTEPDLVAVGRPHPARPRPPISGRVELADGHPFVWGTCFGMRRTTFDALGGFDEAFTGYAGEDTDLAFRARAAGVDVAVVAGATVLHQHHDVYEPPVPQLRATVANARRFRDRHGWWPMGGWLADFEALGLVRRDGDDMVVVRDPTPAEVASARRTVARAFRPD